MTTINTYTSDCGATLVSSWVGQRLVVKSNFGWAVTSWNREERAWTNVRSEHTCLRAAIEAATVSLRAMEIEQLAETNAALGDIVKGAY